MRVLWLSATAPVGISHNGGGWIASLLKNICGSQDLELGIVYEGSGGWGECWEGVSCYPISVFSQRKNKFLRQWNPENEENLLLPEIRRAIADFKPDVIHIWGSESAYGLIAGETSVPCVLHLQGILNPCCNAMFPPGTDRKRVLRSMRFDLRRKLQFLMLDRVMKYRAERELRILKCNLNYIGRTEWDRSVVAIHNPGANYFYGSESLRSSFMQNAGSWKHHCHTPVKLISVLSMPLYKGHDLILKTAKLLKTYSQLDFSWEVYGVYSMELWEKHLKLDHEQLNIKLCGTVSAEHLTCAMKEADIFVHPSYIDNSPNSLCEAQLLGMPVVAIYTGGIPSLVENEKSGLLVPVNDPWQMAERILKLSRNPELAAQLGKQAAETAALRHDPEKITENLLNIYRKLAAR